MLTYYLITTLHVVVCVILILVVLLQSGKGADLAGAFGGGATQTAFGSRGPASFLSKLTTVAAVIFMVTSLSLALMGNKRVSRSIMDQTGSRPAPASKAPVAQPVQPPTPEQIRQMQEQIEKKAAQKAPVQGGAIQTPPPAQPQQAPAPKK